VDFHKYDKITNDIKLKTEPTNTYPSDNNNQEFDITSMLTDEQTKSYIRRKNLRALKLYGITARMQIPRSIIEPCPGGSLRLVFDTMSLIRWSLFGGGGGVRRSSIVLIPEEVVYSSDNTTLS